MSAGFTAPYTCAAAEALGGVSNTRRELKAVGLFTFLDLQLWLSRGFHTCSNSQFALKEKQS